MVRDVEALGVGRHRVHPDRLRQSDGHEVARLFGADAHWDRGVETVAISRRIPFAQAIALIANNGGGAHLTRSGLAAVKRREISEEHERGTRVGTSRRITSDI